MSKSAAMLYEGPEWRYYYCFECRRWFKRHFRYRYAIVPVDDPSIIEPLMRKLESGRGTLTTHQGGVSWIRRMLDSASRYFQRYVP